MMSPSKLPSNSQVGAGPVASAPVVKDAALGDSVAMPATDEGFDAILMLESLAASAAFDTEELGAEALADDVADTDEASDEDFENPLAFLAGLLAMAPPVGAPNDGAANAGDGAAAGGGFGTAAPADPGAGLLANANDTDGAKADAARALATQAQLLVTGTDAAPADDVGAAPRAELFAHTLRNPAAAEVAQATITTHVRDPRWAEELGTRVALLINNRESVASLQLTPQDLGPVDVSITVRDSQATIHFGAAQADTRALLEASLPRLREMLAAQGFNLLDASVSQGFTRQPRADAPAAPRLEGEAEVAAVASRTISLSGLLDVYA